ncbi:MAG TPA: molybdenum cofactor guanylyltransferase MobA [Rudaea sp.]|nr:molybdenum cofactor guanylyltransferase MobA [Rudaea sp.]
MTAAVLAGGEGRRLGGRDKGLALLAGKPLVAHGFAAVQDQVERVLICCNRNIVDYGAFARTCCDREGYRGPLAGIAAALAVCTTPWLLTVPVDSPTPPRDLAQRLFVSHGASPLSVAHDGERIQPLFALYRRELAAAAEAALAADLPVWRWQQDLNATVVDFADVPQAFDNLNTEEDFRRWEEQHHG